MTRVHTIMNKINNEVAKSTSSQGYSIKIAALKEDLYSNYKNGEIVQARVEFLKEKDIKTFEIDNQIMQITKDIGMGKLSDAEINERLHNLQELRSKKDLYVRILSMYNLLIQDYIPYNFVKLKEDLYIRSYDIRTPKDNPARADRKLEKGTVLWKVGEFLSNNAVRHGMYYRVIDKRDGYTYYIAKEYLDRV